MKGLVVRLKVVRIKPARQTASSSFGILPDVITSVGAASAGALQSQLNNPALLYLGPNLCSFSVAFWSRLTTANHKMFRLSQ